MSVKGGYLVRTLLLATSLWFAAGIPARAEDGRLTLLQCRVCEAVSDVKPQTFLDDTLASVKKKAFETASTLYPGGTFEPVEARPILLWNGEAKVIWVDVKFRYTGSRWVSWEAKETGSWTMTERVVVPLTTTQYCALKKTNLPLASF